MFKTFKTRIYPNNETIQYFKECFGYYRFVYNWALTKYNNGEKFSRYTFNKEYNNTICKDQQFDWVNKYNASIKQEAFEDLEVAIKTYYKNLKTNKNKNKTFKLKYRRKYKTNNYFRMHKKYPTNFIVYGNYISINTIKDKPRLELKMAETLFIPNDIIKNIAITERNNKYYIHVIYEVVSKIHHKHKKKCIGIDFGYKNPLVTFNGNKYNSNYKFPKEKIKKLEKLIDYYQTKLSKQLGPRNINNMFYYPSNRYIKTKTKLNKTYLKIYNIRKDWREKITTKLTKKYKNIKVDIPTFNLTKITKINKSILRIGLFDFIKRLYQKAEYYNCNIIEMPIGFISTNKCSICGNINDKNLQLYNRKFYCESCGYQYDRDENASKNIYNYGKKIIYIIRKNR